MARKKVLVPIYKPSKANTKIGIQAAVDIQAGKPPAQVGLNVANAIRTNNSNGTNNGSSRTS
jgi:hypothetical protein